MQEQSRQILELLERFRGASGLVLSRGYQDIGITFALNIPHQQLAETVASRLNVLSHPAAPCEIQNRSQQFGDENVSYTIRTWSILIPYNTVLKLLENEAGLKHFRQEFGPLVKTIQDLSYRLMDVASDVQNCQRMVSEQLAEIQTQRSAAA